MIIVLINDVDSFRSSQTTALLIERLVDRGHEVGVVAAQGLDLLPDGSLGARAVRIKPGSDAKALVARVKRARPEKVRLDEVAAILVRTSPGREGRPGLSDLMLQLLQLQADRGTLILNDPRGLALAASKLYLARFPEPTRPATLVTTHAGTARAFVERLDGRAVLKPLMGTQGRDVFFSRGLDDPNLSAIIDNLLRSGPLMAQAYVPEAPDGDVRMLLVDGRPLLRDGHAALVRRRPAKGELRSNVHLGGEPVSAELTPELAALVEAVGPRLRADGLFFVGLDVIGDKIVECNVYSPGGLGDASRFAGVDFLEPLVEAIEARITLGR